MAGTRPQWADDILHIWFDQLEPQDWFRGGEHVDDLLRARFASVLEEQSAHTAKTFLEDPLLARAAILLFDQVPRNIYRGTAKAFAYDPLACTICHLFLDKGWDADLPENQRQFVIMPLMHSEELSDQRACVRYCEEHLPGNQEFAESHHQMIARFGRFPHRNDALGRETTPEEQRAIDEGFSW